ncbi:hypothetical protein ACHAXN_003418, partial [Cyclotella atomus]
MQLSRESPNVFYGVVDTTGNMGKLTQLLQEIGIEAGYCTEHSLHLNALIAFKDENVPGADGVMKKARALVEFFNKSTQASTKLLKIQRNLTDHNEGKAPVGGLLE